MATDHTWLDHAVTLATANVADGGGPFGAVVVRDGELVAEGVNRVTRDLDPTAHAEVVAIRTACRELGTFVLEGCILYSSCEPCPLCLSAVCWSGLDRVVYAADRDDAAGAGFDDRDLYAMFDRPRDTWPVRLEVQRGLDAAAPFDAWREKADRTPY